MKHKQYSRLNQMVALLFFVVLVAVGAGAVSNRSLTEAVTKPKRPIGAAVPSQFTFTGATGWWQGATNKTSIAVFPSAQTSCFVSAQHITGSIAAKQAKGQKADDALVADGHMISSYGSVAMKVKTDTGIKQYQLQQSSVTNPADATADNGTQVDGGQEFGYIPLSATDFLYIEGYCGTAKDLSTTLPVLQAITFDATK